MCSKINLSILFYSIETTTESTTTPEGTTVTTVTTGTQTETTPEGTTTSGKF